MRKEKRENKSEEPYAAVTSEVLPVGSLEREVLLESEGSPRTEDLPDTKTLFICSGVYQDAAVSYLVLSIDTASLLCTIFSKTTHTHNLVLAASISDEYLPTKAGCGVVGSKILIAGGERGRFKSVGAGVDQNIYIPRPVKDVYSFEAVANDRGKGKIEMLQDISFGQGKTRPLVVELQGKVYALGHFPLSDHPPYLEMLDPKGSNKWVPMPDPPLFRRQSSSFGLDEITYAVVGNRIMVSDANYEVISVFDVTDPSKLWKEIAGTFFENKAKTLALDLEALYGCKGLSGILTYSSESGKVINYYVDDGLSIFQCGQFQLSDSIMPPQVVGKPDSYCLIQLGGPKVCLLLSKLKEPFSNQNRAKEAKVTVLALVFEYEVPGFKLKFLGNSILSYPCPKETTKAEIFGGFVMDISKI